MSGSQRIASHPARQRRRFANGDVVVAVTTMAATVVLTAMVAVVVSTAYQWYVHDWTSFVARDALIGALAGVLYAAPFALRHEYSIPSYLALVRKPQRILFAWNSAFLALFALAFLSQTTVAISRGAAILFYPIGLLALLGYERAVSRLIARGVASGTLPARRVMVIGRADATKAFLSRLDATSGPIERSGIEVVGVVTLPESAGRTKSGFAFALGRAVTKARALMPDVIVIAAPTGEAHLIDAAFVAFERLPVAVHVDTGDAIANYRDVCVRRIAGTPTLSLAEVPLNPLESLLKRAFDFVTSTLALLLLAPALAIIALMIKLDSRGPAFFRQDRLGFNQQRFKIWKFRTMRPDAPGETRPFVQAQRHDPRITAVGRFLRRTSLDELPQLINVLKGEMSLVGPRPHAVEHDRAFEHRLARYPRRLNMKPGITGWAQVNGLRGETDTDEKMRRRLEADLYYIDNWSLLFDAYILLLTVVSPKVFQNAR